MAIEEINVDELADRLDAGAALIDVREPDEYDEARVPGARLIPLATVPDELDAFTAADPVYVICKSGGRSMKACEYAADHGASVVNVAGGTMAWIAAGKPVDSGTSAS